MFKSTTMHLVSSAATKFTQALLQAVTLTLPVFLALGCSNGDPVSSMPKVEISAMTGDFVTRSGTSLALSGNKYRFSGANQYYFFYKDHRMTDDVIASAKALGLNAIRTWAFCEGGKHDDYCFQPEAGVYDEATFRNLDYAIYSAQQAGIKLILVLANNWGGFDHFGGIDQYIQWSGTAHNHDDFYTDNNTRTLYRNYVNYVLNRINTYSGTRYKDDPAILMWELINEPRAQDNQKLLSWVDEMSSYVKSIDANHLVTVGCEGDFSVPFVQIGQLKNIDIMSLHLYPELWGQSTDDATKYLTRHLATAHNIIKKPVYLGEFGLMDKNARPTVFRAWYQVAAEQKTDGIMFWILNGRQYGKGSQSEGSYYPDYDGFGIYNGTPNNNNRGSNDQKVITDSVTLQAIRDYSAGLR